MDNIPPEIIKSSTTFLGYILKKPLEEISELIADNIRSMRFKNQIKIIQGAKDICEKRGLPPQAIQYKLLANLLDFSGWESREGMQQKWINLLANSLTKNSAQDHYLSLTHILNQLSPTEIQIVNAIYKASPDGSKEIISTNLPDEAILLDETNYDKDKPLPDSDIQIYIWNLIRLGCVDYTIYFGNSYRDIYIISLTPLGIRLYEECN